MPTLSFNLNNKSALKNSKFVEKSILDLIKDKIFIEVFNKPEIINPLTVAENKEGKQRLILDLRHVNKFIDKQKFKCEGVKQALSYFIQDGFLFKFDLKSGYHHVDINSEHQKYLGFSWMINGKQRFFQFTSLAFGISSAPFICTELLKPLVKKWRKAGFNIVVFLDDGFCIGKSFESLKSIIEIVHRDLLDAGFLPNYEKSVWNPVKVTEWLGFRWNMLTGLLESNDKKVKRF